ncbi:MAG: hypothetical protein EOP11_11770 [Proteobacteria bacterium]|nr:MAG: hypothetical protein EOP11_11770 [Pseudomonadota bacterium]
MKAIFLGLSFLFLTPAFARDESGPGNGTDYVKVLFADAQFELNRALLPWESADGWALSPPVAAWLSLDRFTSLKGYTRRMELRFQAGACSDESQKPASICFFTDDGPYVVVALSENRHTSREQAMAMLLHEAGHFTGETDHLFLDRMGVELVNALRAPRLLVGEASETEIVANIFAAKADCEAGRSSLAARVKEEAALSLARQCAERNLACEGGGTDYLFHAAQEFKDGVGFSMKVTCSAKAVWRR